MIMIMIMINNDNDNVEGMIKIRSHWWLLEIARVAFTVSSFLQICVRKPRWGKQKKTKVGKFLFFCDSVMKYKLVYRENQGEESKKSRKYRIDKTLVDFWGGWGVGSPTKSIPGKIDLIWLRKSLILFIWGGGDCPQQRGNCSRIEADSGFDQSHPEMKFSILTWSDCKRWQSWTRFWPKWSSWRRGRGLLKQISRVIVFTSVLDF